MKISINHIPHELNDNATVADALAMMAARPPFAVAVNTIFIPLVHYRDHVLHNGDRVEVVSPVTGG